jgi:hypothetical protein
MPFKAAAAEAGNKAQPSAEAIAIMEDSMSEVYRRRRRRRRRGGGETEEGGRAKEEHFM